MYWADSARTDMMVLNLYLLLLYEADGPYRPERGCRPGGYLLPAATACKK